MALRNLDRCHGAWIIHLKERLNAGLLPEGFYALSERAGSVNSDVLALRMGRAARFEAMPHGPIAVADAPPKVSVHMRPEARAYALKRRTLTIRHRSDDRVVAMMQIVSPANKDGASSVKEFVDKAIACLRAGCHLLVIDLFPPGHHDPGGMHGAIWARIEEDHPYRPPPDKPLTLAGYVADVVPSVYLEPLSVGDRLVDMPLFLDPDWYINVPLDETYTTAYRGVPERWRRVVEG